MKRALKLAAIVAVLTAGLFQTRAAQTNLVQNLNFQLTVWSQGQTLTNGSIIISNATSQKVITRDIIKLLGNATSNQFSASAKLLLIKQLGVPNPVTSVIVRDKAGTNVINVDVSGFFRRSANETVVTSSQFNTTTKMFSGSVYRDAGFSLQDDGDVLIAAHFDVSGFSITTFMSVTDKSGHVIGEADQGTLTAGGTGDYNGTPLVIQGTISTAGKIVEIH